MKYEKVKNLILLKAHEYSKKYSVEFEELRDQGNLIYVEALRTHDQEKAAFITHLYSRLRTLGDHAKTLKRQGGNAANIEVCANTYQIETINIECLEPSDFYHNPTITPLTTDNTESLDLEYGVTQFLSEDAKVALDWLLKGHWSIPGTSRKPTRNSFISNMKKAYNWIPSKAQNIWEELKEVWQEHEASGVTA